MGNLTRMVVRHWKSCMLSLLRQSTASSSAVVSLAFKQAVWHRCTGDKEQHCRPKWSFISEEESPKRLPISNRSSRTKLCLSFLPSSLLLVELKQFQNASCWISVKKTGNVSQGYIYSSLMVSESICKLIAIDRNQHLLFLFLIFTKEKVALLCSIYISLEFT